MSGSWMSVRPDASSVAVATKWRSQSSRSAAAIASPTTGRSTTIATLIPVTLARPGLIVSWRCMCTLRVRAQLEPVPQERSESVFLILPVDCRPPCAVLASRYEARGLRAFVCAPFDACARPLRPRAFEASEDPSDEIQTISSSRRCNRVANEPPGFAFRRASSRIARGGAGASWRRPVVDAEQGLRKHALQPAGPDNGRQRQGPKGRLDVLDRRVARP